MKEIHTETEEEIEEGERMPAHFVFPMYIDLIVDNIPDNFKKIFGFNPIDEPLLKYVFVEKDFMIVKEFEKELLLPNPELLLAMKINSLPNRDREHKRLKDIENCVDCMTFCTQFSIWKTATIHAINNAVIHILLYKI